jgi:branched-chain amino acid aminotransferase
MAVDELLEQIQSGECSEVFACGTTAIVSPIEFFADRGAQDYVLSGVNVVAAQLKESLLAL